MSRKWPMNEKYDYTNESILCKHCGNQTIMRMVSRGIYIKEIKDDPIDEQLRYELKTLICPTCEGINVLEYQEWSEAEPEDIQPNIKYLYPSSRSLENTSIRLQPVRSTYEEAEKAFNAGAYALSVIGCRKVVELLCKLHGVEEKNLYKNIRQLYEKEIIDKMLYKWADALRIFGNDAAHTQSTLLKEDAEDVMNFTFSFMEYLLDLRWKFSALMKRRQPELSAKNDSEGQVSTLLKALGDRNQFIRYYAAENLIHLNVELEKALSILIELFKTEEGELFKSIDECLTRASSLAVSDLIKLVKDSSIPSKKRSAAIKTLGKISTQDDTATIELLSLLDDASTVDDGIKSSAIASIRKLGLRDLHKFSVFYEQARR